MSTNDFYYLTVSNVTPDEADIISALAFEVGAQGTEEILSFQQTGREYEPETLEKEITEIKIYFLTPPDSTWLEGIQLLYPHCQLKLHADHNRDWLAEWKKDFKPFCLAGKTWIVPTWCAVPEEAKRVIRIDPGMAFGTGTHETTRLAASFIEDFASQVIPKSLLDVGTGTGILALQAELIGCQKVLANDIDPEARRVARENLSFNQAKFTKMTDLSLEHITGDWDWVVANIIDGVLVKLQADLKSRVKPGGKLLLTGILSERDSLFLSEFSFLDFRIIERRALGEWIGYLLEKN